MARVVLLTGGNVGDTKELLRTAQRLVNGRIGAVLRCSHCYTSAPWGFEAAQPFVNQVLVADTDLTPHEVLAELQRIERELGRNRAAEAVERAATGQRYVSRPIDIDILLYDDEVLSSPELTIPHPASPNANSSSRRCARCCATGAIPCWAVQWANCAIIC